jgi:hypothetical protein
MPIHESSYFIFTLVDRKVTKLIYNLVVNFLSKITGSFSTPSKDNPTVAIVAAVNEKAVLVATDTGYAQVRPELVRGNVVMLLPFIGAIANLVGN